MITLNNSDVLLAVFYYTLKYTPFSIRIVLALYSKFKKNHSIFDVKPIGKFSLHRIYFYLFFSFLVLTIRMNLNIIGRAIRKHSMVRHAKVYPINFLL